MIFYKNKITADAEFLGQELGAARQARRMKINSAAEELKINAAYLEALERGRFEKLPPGIYGRNFLREYALFLGLDADKLCQIYDSETEAARRQDKLNLFSRKVPGARYFLAFPKIIKSFLIALGVLVCAGYFVFSLNKIISPPALSVLSPGDNYITSERFVEIRGQTDPEAEITVNGELVLKKENGFFEKKVDLKSGLNTISISAQKKYSRKNNVVKKILVKN